MGGSSSGWAGTGSNAQPCCSTIQATLSRCSMFRSGKTSPAATAPPSHRFGPTGAAPAAAGTVGSWMSRYRFLTRPGWIIISIVVVLLVILMLNLSAWQFRRLHERRSFNAEVRTRTSAPAQPYDTVVPPGTTVDGARPEEWKTVTVTGTFDPSAQVLIRNRSLDAAPGYHVVTPLKRAD